MIYVSWKIFRYFTTEKPNVSLDKHRNRKNTIVIGHLTGSQSLLKTVVNDKDDSISINTFEEVSSQLKEIKQLSGDTTEIEIVLHTPGGSLFYSQLIANMIRHWKGKTIARIVGYSASGGTLIALACDQIIMGEDSALGPIDPQLSGYDVMSGKLTMAFSFQEGYEMFSDQSVTINEKNLFVEVLKRRTMKLIPPYMEFLEKLLSKNYPDKQRRTKIIKYFMANQAHSLPIFYDNCVDIGVNVILESTFEMGSGESVVVNSDDSNESEESSTNSDEKIKSNKSDNSDEKIKSNKSDKSDAKSKSDKSDEKIKSDKSDLSDLSSVLKADSEELDRSEPSLESYQIRLKELEMAIVDAKAHSPKWPKEKSASVDEAVTTLWTFMNNNGKYVNKALY